MLLIFSGVYGGCGCFVEYWGLGLLVFGLCIVEFISGALVIWLDAGLLVINYLLGTCILLTHRCTATTTGHFTWGVVF